MADPCRFQRNETPIWLADRHSTRHRRRVRSLSRTSSNSFGIPTGLVTTRHAPTSDTFRTLQSVLVPSCWNEIFAPFKTRPLRPLRRSLLIVIASADIFGTETRPQNPRATHGRACAFCQSESDSAKLSLSSFRKLTCGTFRRTRTPPSLLRRYRSGLSRSRRRQRVGTRLTLTKRRAFIAKYPQG